MIPSKFDYIKANSVSEAVSLLGKHSDAKLLAGGHSLLPAMKLRLNQPEVLVDIGGISELKNISEDGDAVVVGANCTHAEIASSDVVAKGAKALAEAAAEYINAIRNWRKSRMIRSFAVKELDGSLPIEVRRILDEPVT